MENGNRVTLACSEDKSPTKNNTSPTTKAIKLIRKLSFDTIIASTIPITILIDRYNTFSFKLKSNLISHTLSSIN